VQRVDLQLSEFSRRAGSVLVAHSSIGVQRGLEPGETVLVLDGTQRHWLATVRDISFDLTETFYRLELDEELDVYGLLREARALVAAPRRVGGRRS
jgi:hypothetical protein